MEKVMAGALFALAVAATTASASRRRASLNRELPDPALLGPASAI